MWTFRSGHPGKLNRGFRHRPDRLRRVRCPSATACRTPPRPWASSCSPSTPAASRTTPRTSPWWVFWTSAAFLAAGTYAGGWRIIRTLGRKIIDLGPAEGFAAETVASSVLFFNALVLHAPISTTHTITSAIMGVGATKRLTAVRWNVAGNIVIAWITTFPAAAAIACVVYFCVRPLFG